MDIQNIKIIMRFIIFYSHIHYESRDLAIILHKCATCIAMSGRVILKIYSNSFQSRAYRAAKGGSISPCSSTVCNEAITGVL